MNFCILLFLTFTSGFAFITHNHFEIEQSKSDDSVILSEIISNYLTKYFRGSKIFIMIILAPSENDHRNFQEDFFGHLFENAVSNEFSSISLDRLDNAIHEHRNAFNIIFVDDSKSLS